MGSIPCGNRKALWITALWGSLAALLASGAAEARVLHVRSRSAALEADGSDRAPFSSLGEALRAARDGDEVVLGPGIYTERVEVARRVRLRGPREAVIAGPGAQDTVVRLLAPAELEGLTVRGGAVGVEVRAPSRLEGLHLSGQRTAAITITGVRTELSGGELVSISNGKPVGVEVQDGGELHARGVRLSGPFRFGIRAKRSRLRLDTLEVEGATVGVGCFDGCDGVIRRSSLTQGPGAGLLVSSGRLVARDNLLSRYEQCAGANPGGELILEDNVTALCELTGIGAFSAKLEVAHHLHVGPASTAAIELVGSRATVRDSVLVDPGIIGVGIRGGTVELSELLVRAARPDRDGLFGDGIYALTADSLTVRGAILESNAGTALTANHTPVRVVDLEAWFNRVGGVMAQNRATIHLLGVSLSYNLGPALVAMEAARIEVEGGRLWRNGEGPAAASCGEAASVWLTGVRIDPEPAAPLPCVARGP